MDRLGILRDQIATTAASLVGADLAAIRNPLPLPQNHIMYRVVKRQRRFVVYALRVNGFFYREIGAYMAASVINVQMISRRNEDIPRLVAHFSPEQLDAYRTIVAEDGTGCHQAAVMVARPMMELEQLAAAHGQDPVVPPDVSIRLEKAEKKIREIIGYLNKETKVSREALAALQAEFVKMKRDWEFLKLTA